jgi:hypothetical protein
MDTNLQQKKIELIQWLSTLTDASVIEKLLKLRKEQQNDWWDEISEAEKASIDKGLKDAEEGKLKPHSEARKAYEKWL